MSQLQQIHIKKTKLFKQKPNQLTDDITVSSLVQH